MASIPWWKRAAIFAALASANPALGQPASSDPLAKIGHIVVILQENRSFDNLFGKFPGANGIANAGDAAIQIGPDGNPYKFLPQPVDSDLKPPDVDKRFAGQIPNRPFLLNHYVSLDDDTGDLIHEFYTEQQQINDGAMNRYVELSNAKGLAMGYYDLSGTYLWKLAQQYTLGDAMFHSAFGGSLLNHTFLVCSCALRWPNAATALVAKLDPATGAMTYGQVSPDGYVINDRPSVYLHPPKETDTSRLVPPQTMPHIGDRLDAKGIAWKWYSGGYDDAMAGHPAKLFKYQHQPLAFFQDLAAGTPAQQAHLQDYQDLVRDIQQNTLPQVVFYKPIGQFNQHPGYANITDGDKHLSEVVGMLQRSPAYGDMLILITYDENGGNWDHVAPPRRDKWGPGTRVPLIAAGPMVKHGYVDHTPYDFGSILRTIEVRFGLDALNDADGNAYPMRNVLR
jgi:acid phosphatase